jgi:hypothetical protein
VTSGLVLVYDSFGTLVLQGGITPARDHEGDNTGRASVTSLIARAACSESSSPVFGCPLFPNSSTRDSEAPP